MRRFAGASTRRRKEPSLALLELVWRRRRDRLAAVVAIERQGDVLPAALGLDVLDGVTVALPDVGVGDYWMSDAGGARTIFPVLNWSKIAVNVLPCDVLEYFSG